MALTVVYSRALAGLDAPLVRGQTRARRALETTSGQQPRSK